MTQSDPPNPSRSNAAGQVLQLVTFEVGGEEFGVEILRVQEIIRSAEPTAMPQSPPDVLGVINLRGRVIPIVDLRRRFGFDSAEPTSDSRIIIVEVGVGVLGFWVDRVHEVLRIDATTVDPACEIAVHLEGDFVSGVGKLEDRLLIVLDLDKLFDGMEIDGMEIDGLGEMPMAA